MTLAALVSILLLHLMAAISPGPSFVVAVRTAASEGFRPAAGLALGLGLGAAAWAFAALAGLALLFQILPALFTALKIAGGLTLIWIAIATWRHAADPLPGPAGASPRSALSAIRLGLTTQLANPKPAIFFGAVFVGLVPPGSSPAALALILGAILVNETAWYLLVARLFSLPSPRAAYARARRGIDRSFGGLLALLGAKVALT